MAGWSHQKRVVVEKAFYEYLNRCYVNSKDSGRICLGENLYEGQRHVITQIFDALEADIHRIFVLKSRQLGISTIIRALTIFLLGVHSGLKGAIIFDTDQNKSQSRSELEVMISDLPRSLKFPTITSNNRAGLKLANNSEVLFMSAGVRKSKTSGTLGRSVGLTIAHLSELCSYDNDEGLEAFEQSLSEVHPDRLYIYESTARGFNRWNLMYDEAKEDPHHCKCIFLGWWSKDSQRIEQGTLDFKLYGEAPASPKEQEKIDLVKKLYGVEITPEQLAWVRRKYDPAATSENPNYSGDDEANPVRTQEQPWTEDEAWQQTGSVFFPAQQLTDQTNKYVSDKFKKYMYIAGAEFVDMKIYPAATPKQTDLKVWEEPDPDGSYVLGIDPAFGENEHNNRSSIEILRCYADGIDQVAEYASPLINTQQLAWVIASLLGWYGFGRAEARYILELNGPGTAVFNEIKQLRFKLDNAYYPNIEEKGVRDVFRNVKTYIFTRPDGMVAGQNYHFKTNVNLKVMIMERLRDFTSNGTFRCRSMSLIKEMNTITRDGDTIAAPASMQDDRVLAAAFAAHYWETNVRRGLITAKKTREAESARQRRSIVDQTTLFHQNQLQVFFDRKRLDRTQAMRAAARMAWRGR